MTMRQLLERGATATRRAHRLDPDSARCLWELYSTEYRYEQLVTRLRGRRGLIRTANRKWLRQIGASFRNA